MPRISASHDGNGHIYHLLAAPYDGSQTESFTIANGPLQPGNYTLVVQGIADRAQNVIAPFTLNFTVAGAAPYTVENQNNNSPATATPLASPTSQSDGTLSPFPGTSITGSNPWFTASARLRGAGHPLDLVTANFNSDTISVFLGNGDGTLQAPITYVLGSQPIALAIGDLNGDGIADIAVANYNSSTISILRGDGQGAFTLVQTLTAGSNPRGIAIADLDGQHGNDLVVSNWGSNNVSVLLNQGGGTFASAVNYPVGNNPAGLAVADLNGDGKLDVVVANWSSNTVSVLPGNGDGTFGTQVNYGCRQQPL